MMTLNLLPAVNTIHVPLDKLRVLLFNKINPQMGWLDLTVEDRSDLRRSLFFLVSHNLTL